MLQRFLFIMLSISVLWLFLATIHAQEDLTRIDNSVFTKAVRPAVLFQHDEHNQKAGIDECNECHHIYEDGERLEYESSEDQMCSECHTLQPSDNPLPLMKAFHKNCKGCHTEKKSGPIMCGECHTKP